MKVAIRGQGYVSATEAFVSGNLLAARACETLAGRLQGCAGMAGDDATATDFAASYDEAATESLGALAELVGSLGALGHLAEASLDHHLTADRESTVMSAYRVDAPPTRADDSVGMLVATPPSSLGADSSSLPHWASVVLDFLEGALWPDADTDRLRAAAATWRSATVSVSLLAAHCDTALLGLDEESSPEVPLAIATTQDLRGRVEVLADQLTAIGTSCETYADQVDAKRAEILDLLEELAIELGIGAVVAGALSLLSGGLAAGAGSAAAGGRIAAASRDLKVIVDALRVVNGSTAAGLRPVATTVRDSRAYLARLAAARRSAMTERGSAMLGRTHGDGWLLRHERGGHTLERHVGKSDEDLLARLRNERRPGFASTFADQRSAEAAIQTLLERHRAQLGDWLASGAGSLRLQDDLGYVVGRTADRAGRVFDVSGVRAILLHDQSMPEGYRILTAYPRP